MSMSLIKFSRNSKTPFRNVMKYASIPFYKKNTNRLQMLITYIPIRFCFFIFYHLYLNITQHVDHIRYRYSIYTLNPAYLKKHSI